MTKTTTDFRWHRLETLTKGSPEPAVPGKALAYHLGSIVRIDTDHHGDCLTGLQDEMIVEYAPYGAPGVRYALANSSEITMSSLAKAKHCAEGRMLERV